MLKQNPTNTIITLLTSFCAVLTEIAGVHGETPDTAPAYFPSRGTARSLTINH